MIQIILVRCNCNFLSPDACIPVAELGLFFGSTSSWVGVESVVEIGFNEGVWLQSKTNSEEEALYSELRILRHYLALPYVSFYQGIFLYIGTVALKQSSHYPMFTVQRRREERRKGKDGGGKKVWMETEEDKKEGETRKMGSCLRSVNARHPAALMSSFSKLCCLKCSGKGLHEHTYHILSCSLEESL